jgi:death-on-curing protein
MPLWAQAGAYLFHLVKNHPFLDGNKRVGTACCLVFLYVNGHKLDPKLDKINKSIGQTFLEEVVFAVARGTMKKDDLIAFLKNHLKPF